MRLLTRRQIVKMKLVTAAQWWLDDDNSHRQPILFVWVLTIPLVAGQALLWFNTPWSTTAQVGVSLIGSAVLLAIATVCSFLIREDYGP